MRLSFGKFGRARSLSPAVKRPVGDFPTGLFLLLGDASVVRVRDGADLDQAVTEHALAQHLDHLLLQARMPDTARTDTGDNRVARRAHELIKPPRRARISAASCRPTSTRWRSRGS